jgi:hypothetical protein
MVSNRHNCLGDLNRIIILTLYFKLRCNKLIVLIFIAGRVMLFEAFLRHPGAFTACGIFVSSN